MGNIESRGEQENVWLFFQAEDGIRASQEWLEFRRVLFRSAKTKKPSAPEMFTESEDMFAADFDVSLRVKKYLKPIPLF